MKENIELTPHAMWVRDIDETYIPAAARMRYPEGYESELEPTEFVRNATYEDLLAAFQSVMRSGSTVEPRYRRMYRQAILRKEALMGITESRIPAIEAGIDTQYLRSCNPFSSDAKTWASVKDRVGSLISRIVH